MIKRPVMSDSLWPHGTVAHQASLSLTISQSLLQYSCLENSMDRGAWGATVHGVTRSQTPTLCDPMDCSSPGARGFHTQLDEGPETP